MKSIMYNLNAQTRQVITKWAVDPESHRTDSEKGISKQIIEDIETGQKYLKVVKEEYIPVSDSWVEKLQKKYRGTK